MSFASLKKIDDAVPLTALSMAQMKELQVALTGLGYAVGPIDSLLGLKTRTAWADFKEDQGQNMPDFIGPASIALLEKRVNDLAKPQHSFATKADTLAAIQAECIAQGIGLKTQIAYVFATTGWETNNKFQPVREAYWVANAENWRKNHLAYYPYYGRGYVQLTWKSNYKKYSDILGVDLVEHPDKALEPEVSLFILVHGFKHGAFTSHKITEYINANHTDFLHARRCINGMDKAAEIAHSAQQHLQQL